MSRCLCKATNNNNDFFWIRIWKKYIFRKLFVYSKIEMNFYNVFQSIQSFVTDTMKISSILEISSGIGRGSSSGGSRSGSSSRTSTSRTTGGSTSRTTGTGSTSRRTGSTSPIRTGGTSTRTGGSTSRRTGSSSPIRTGSTSKTGSTSRLTGTRNGITSRKYQWRRFGTWETAGAAGYIYGYRRYRTRRRYYDYPRKGIIKQFLKKSVYN